VKGRRRPRFGLLGNRRGFAIDEIPYGKMPADDALWYPAFLARKPMKGYFKFAEDGVTLLSHAIEEVDALESV